MHVHTFQALVDRGLTLLAAVQPLVEAHELDDAEEDHGDVGGDKGEGGAGVDETPAQALHPGGEGADLALEVVPVGVRVRHGPVVAMS